MILYVPLGVWPMLIGEIKLKINLDTGAASVSLLVILMGIRLGAYMISKTITFSPVV